MEISDEARARGYYLVYNDNKNSDIVATSVPLNRWKPGMGSVIDPAVRERLISWWDKGPRNPPPKRPQRKPEDVISADMRRSTSALKLYNDMVKSGEGCELELVDTLRSNWFMFNGIWYHVNFEAKPKDGTEDQKRVYFAELQHFGEEGDVLTKFCEVEPKGCSDVEKYGGCLACKIRYRIYHPPGGGFVGVRSRRVQAPTPACSSHADASTADPPTAIRTVD